MCIATEENELGNNKSSSCGMTKEPRIMEHVKQLNKLRMDS